MNIFGIEHTKREVIYLFLILILLLSFLTISWTTQKTIESYEYTYKQNYLNCQKAILEYTSPAVDVWGRYDSSVIENITMPEGME